MGNVASIDHSETRLQTTDTSKAFCLWQKSYGFSKKLYHSKQTVCRKSRSCLSMGERSNRQKLIIFQTSEDSAQDTWYVPW